MSTGQSRFQSLTSVSQYCTVSSTRARIVRSDVWRLIRTVANVIVLYCTVRTVLRLNQVRSHRGGT